MDEENKNSHNPAPAPVPISNVDSITEPEKQPSANSPEISTEPTCTPATTSPEEPQNNSSETTSEETANSNSKHHSAKSVRSRFTSLSKKQKRIMIIAASIVFVLLLIIVLFATHVLCIHNWKPATCSKPAICTICNRTGDPALGHEWGEATCTKAKQCTRCTIVSGKPLGHKVAEWTVDQESTCTDAGKRHGTCSVCGKTVSENLELKDHTLGDWEITKEATDTSKGERVRKCTVCGQAIEKEDYELTAEQRKEYYIQSCQTYDYKDLARNANSYKGNHIKAKGEVVQVMQDGSMYALRVNITQGSYGIWSDTVYVTYFKGAGDPNIIEDDIITLYGEIKGTTSYKSVLGATITLPDISARYIDIN